MANPEHLEILKQGVEVWNRWRGDNPNVKPDLSDADLLNANLRYANLSGVILSGVILTGVDLSKANLRGTNLSKANLRDANLSNANLSNANLRGTSLSGVILTGAKLKGARLWGANLRYANLSSIDLSDINLRYVDLSNANLSNANLSGADLNNANLSGVDLSDINLRYADLNNANLRNANLRSANLSYANLRGTSLSGVILTGAKLSRANLNNANLSGADLRYSDLSYANLRGTSLSNANLSNANLRGTSLSGADLRGTDLIGQNFSGVNLSQTNLSGTNLSQSDLISTDLTNGNITGACLYGTARDNWKIDRIRCDYVYFDPEGKERTPKDRDFRPGEFEELYKSLPTIEYYFENGFTPIDAVIMDRVVQAINEKHPDYHLEMVSFDKRGTPHATFTVLHKEVADQALQQIAIIYGEKIKYLEGQRDQANALLSQFMTKLIEQPKMMFGENKGQICFSPTGSVTQNQEIAIAKDEGRASINKTASGNIINIDGIQTFTDNLKKSIDELGLKPDKRDELETAVQSVEKEIHSPSPDVPKVNEYVATIRNILDGVAGSVIATGLLQMAQTLLR